jgi:hypothetical protein
MVTQLAQGVTGQQFKPSNSKPNRHQAPKLKYPQNRITNDAIISMCATIASKGITIPQVAERMYTTPTKAHSIKNLSIINPALRADFMKACDALINEQNDTAKVIPR